jgi:ribonuclease P protein component
VLDRQHRLTSSAGFTGAVRSGRRSGSRTLVVHLHRGDPASRAHGVAGPAPQAGLVVSRAVGNAVVRNRTKRRLRHLLRDRLDALPAGAVLVVRALPAAGDASAVDLGRDLDRGLRRVLPGRSPSESSAGSSGGSGTGDRTGSLR